MAYRRQFSIYRDDFRIAKRLIWARDDAELAAQSAAIQAEFGGSCRYFSLTRRIADDALPRAMQRHSEECAAQASRLLKLSRRDIGHAPKRGGQQCKLRSIAMLRRQQRREREYQRGAAMRDQGNCPHMLACPAPRAAFGGLSLAEMRRSSMRGYMPASELIAAYRAGEI